MSHPSAGRIIGEAGFQYRRVFSPAFGGIHLSPQDYAISHYKTIFATLLGFLRSHSKGIFSQHLVIILGSLCRKHFSSELQRCSPNEQRLIILPLFEALSFSGFSCRLGEVLGSSLPWREMLSSGPRLALLPALCWLPTATVPRQNNNSSFFHTQPAWRASPNLLFLHALTCSDLLQKSGSQVSLVIDCQQPARETGNGK